MTTTYQLPDSYDQVRYHGSLAAHRGQLFSAEECSCIPPVDKMCDGWYLERRDGDRITRLSHVRRESFTVLDTAVAS